MRRQVGVQVPAQVSIPRLRQLPGHHQPVPFFATTDMFGGLPIEIAGAEISDKIGVPVAADHVHSVPELYLLISPHSGGAEIEVSVDGQRSVLTSPALFYVPTGALHSFVTTRAEVGSFCLGILLWSNAKTPVESE